MEQYEIISQIGVGSFSVVYKVRCKVSKAEFAMKEIKIDCLTDKEREYAKTEVRILKMIKHPNLIRFEKSFMSGNCFYIVMELAAQGDLQKKIVQHQEINSFFPADLIWKYSFQIISGLFALHSNKILHRDIKASNVFLMENDLLKIGDFNIGKEINETTLCTKIGTPAMMSPEIWKGEPYNLKADIWSLGCLIYQMVSLNPPFSADNYAALYIKITNSKVKYLKNYPKSLNLFIKKMLQKDPKKRPSCLELLQHREFNKFKGSLVLNIRCHTPTVSCLPRLSSRRSRKSRKPDLSPSVSSKFSNKSPSLNLIDGESAIKMSRIKKTPSPRAFNKERIKLSKNLFFKLKNLGVNKLNLEENKGKGRFELQPYRENCQEVNPAQVRKKKNYSLVVKNCKFKKSLNKKNFGKSPKPIQKVLSESKLIGKSASEYFI